jgi:ABC-2 type transport system ATP-binding protein
MLKITHLSHSFGQHIIFDDLDLNFLPGQITGIVGKNGIGKTTLFRILCQIYQLQSGSVNLNNEKIVASDIVFMPTEPYFYPYMKGIEYLEIVANNKTELDKSVHYSNLLDIPCHELVDNYSTGMRKKIAFAALFALEKPIIILDEPYNGVDLESNELIKKIIATQYDDKIVILSSHILSTITDVCNCVYHFTENHEVTLFMPNQYIELEQKLHKSTLEKISLLSNKEIVEK